ncbi:hypothetical protein GTY86_20250, partial [Streptomyces sp. SID5770]|nr:hypothetical protein [Streptomyces sp. SID5770]
MIPLPATDPLRRALDDTAYAITPSPAPLQDIQQASRKLRVRRRAAAVTASCGLLLAPIAVSASHYLKADSPAAPTASQPFQPGPAQVVMPGERVSAGAGVELWLTKQGKHWSTPQGGTQFRSVSDGNAANPGMGVQQEGVNG